MSYYIHTTWHEQNPSSILLLTACLRIMTTRLFISFPSPKQQYNFATLVAQRSECHTKVALIWEAVYSPHPLFFFLSSSSSSHLWVSSVMALDALFALGAMSSETHAIRTGVFSYIWSGLWRREKDHRFGMNHGRRGGRVNVICFFFSLPTP